MDKNTDKEILSEDIPIELLQSGLKISEKEVKDHRYLILEEIEGNMLNNIKLTINAKGLENGLRGEEDGICFFGIEEKKDGKNVNDFILNIDPNYSNNLQNPHIFVIYYKRDNQNFYMKNFDENKEKYFMFVSMEEAHPINEYESFLFSVLDYNFKLSVDEKTKNLNIEYGQSNNIEKITLTKDKQKYLLGRKSDCDITINDPGFSREQSTIFYDPHKQSWFIKDGGENLSRTGTWLYIDKPYCLTGNMKFKLGPSLMKIDFLSY